MHGPGHRASRCIVGTHRGAFDQSSPTQFRLHGVLWSFPLCPLLPRALPLILRSSLFFRPAMTLNSPGIHHCPCSSRSPHVIVMCAFYPLFAIMVVRAPPLCCALDIVSSYGFHQALLRGLFFPIYGQFVGFRIPPKPTVPLLFHCRRQSCRTLSSCSQT